MRPWLTIALALASTSTAEPEDEALAAYVRFARTTLPKLEKAWAAPHRADATKQTGRRGGRRARLASRRARTSSGAGGPSTNGGPSFCETSAST